jgi:hypothetical protein
MKVVLGWLILFNIAFLYSQQPAGVLSVPNYSRSNILLGIPLLAKIRIDIPREATTIEPPKFAQMESRLIIKNADITSEVADCDAAISRLTEIASQKRGFVISSIVNLIDQNRKSAHVVMRVPNRNYLETVNEIVGFSSKVISKSIHGSDVTEERKAILSNIESKRKTEKRYEKMMASAKKIQDILSLEKYLGDIRDDIEQLDEKLRTLDDTIALLTIRVNFREQLSVVVIKSEGFWEKMGMSYEKGVVGLIDVVGIGIAFTVTAFPVIALILVFVFFYVLQKKKNKNEQEKITDKRE